MTPAKVLAWATREEPVLSGSLVPLAVTVGLLTQDQASVVVKVCTGVVAVAVEAAAAWKVRSRVTSPATAARLAKQPA